METLPEVSVIVTCYDRKEYILDALSSIAKQSAPRELFEVIVVKNYIDEQIDNFCSAHGFTLLLAKGRSQGELAAEGIENARGRILSFLDDDDMFTESKISILLEHFSEEEVIFYHNAHSVIDSKGNLKEGYKLKPPLNTIAFDISTDLNLRNVLRANSLYHLGTFFFNLSSISVLREIAIVNLSELHRMNSRPDDFIFFASLKHYGRKIMIGAEELTFYREHVSASNPDQSRLALINLKRRHISGSEIIMEMLAGTPFVNVAKSQLIISRMDLYRLERDLKSYLKSSFNYFKAQRMNNYPLLYILINYILGLFEAGNNELFRKLRRRFLALVGDLRS